MAGAAGKEKNAARMLYLVRHGDVGGGGRYIGSSDPPLSDLGRRQVRSLAGFFKNIPVDAVYCSPMRRCRESLGELAVQAPVHICPDLREIDFGLWEGKSFADIVAEDERGVAAWAAAGADFVFPRGEALRSFHKRVGAVEAMVREAAGHSLVLVSHGGVVRHLLCLLLGLPWDKYLLFEVAAGACSTLTLHTGGAVLTGFNITGECYGGGDPLHRGSAQRQEFTGSGKG